MHSFRKTPHNINAIVCCQSMCNRLRHRKRQSKRPTNLIFPQPFLAPWAKWTVWHTNKLYNYRLDTNKMLQPCMLHDGCGAVVGNMYIMLHTQHGVRLYRLRCDPERVSVGSILGYTFNPKQQSQLIAQQKERARRPPPKKNPQQTNWVNDTENDQRITDVEARDDAHTQ